MIYEFNKNLPNEWLNEKRERDRKSVSKKIKMLARVFSRLSWGKGVPSGLVIKKQQNSHKTPTKIFRENRPNIKYLQQKLLTNLTMILVRPLTYSYIYNFLLEKPFQ